MSADVLKTYETLALADLGSWFGDVSQQVEIVRRAASVLILVSFQSTVLERWAELRDGLVGDTLVFADIEMPTELARLARRASDGRWRIDSYDRRLDDLQTFGALPPAAMQYLTVWSASEIAPAVKASSVRMRVIWQTLGLPGVGGNR